MLFGRDLDSFPFHAPVVPEPIVDLEELRKHYPAEAPGTYREARNLRQHHIVVWQNPTAPEVEEE